MTAGMPAAPLSPAGRFDLAHLGEMLSDPSRVAVLLALMDGSSRPATELASLAGISAPTASVHLRRLVEGGLLRVEPLGRHRYFSLASDQVAETIEALAVLRLGPAEASTRTQQRRVASSERLDLERARTCYRHLAGRLGVAWFAALERERFVALEEGALILTGRGRDALGALGLAPARWPEGKPCLDWTERRSHLGGPLGALLTQHLFDLRWITRRRDGRAVRLTTAGERELARRFNLRA